MTLPGGTDPATVVRGAAGFLGANLARHLTPAARLFTRSTPFCHRGSPHPALVSADVVFYLASQISPAVAERSPDLVREDLGTLRRLLDCLRANPRRPLVVKLGYSQLEMKQTDEGVATLKSVASKYPSSNAAKLAQERLRRLSQQTAH